jgi:iduronate 2-sulfatase
MVKKSIISILFFVLVQSSFNAQAQKEPNILMISIDDLKPMQGCYGQSSIITSDMDELAAVVTVFPKYYCQQAVCSSKLILAYPKDHNALLY